MKANFVYKTEPYEHQVNAVHLLYDKEYFALFAQQGTGKTKILIDIVSNLYLEKKIEAVMIIAPNGVHEQWANEQIPLHSPIPYITYVWSSKLARQNIRDRESIIYTHSECIKYFLVNVEAFSTDSHLSIFKDFVKNNKTFIAVDESTRIKSPSAKRTVNIIQGLSNITKIGSKIVKVEPYAKYRAILTGTPVTNRPTDVWSQVEFLKTNFFGRDFYSFKARYCIEVLTLVPGTHKSYYRKITVPEMESVRRYGKTGKEVADIARIVGLSESSVRFILDNPSVKSPYKHLDELKAVLSTISFSVLKKDCLDLPPKIYEKIIVELSVDQKRVYKELRHSLYAEYAGKDLTALNKVTLIGRLQQITGGFFPFEENGEKKAQPFDPNPKIDALIEDLDECSDFPVIVVAHFVSEIKNIQKALQKAYSELRIEVHYGEVSKTDRADIREAFKAGEVDILIGNAATFGEGYNFQICHTVYFYSNWYSLGEREQMEDRVHRPGQGNSVLYKDIIAKDSVDETIYSILKQKRDLLDYIRGLNVKDFI